MTSITTDTCIMCVVLCASIISRMDDLRCTYDGVLIGLIFFVVEALYVLFFFFFQAEDGIRDYKVTGVQTCALPICGRADLPPVHLRARAVRRAGHPARADHGRAGRGTPKPGRSRAARASRGGVRSEERRVGKEGRSRWSPYH